MFGMSIFMNEELSEETKTYVKRMSDIGFSGIFTSMHIPEDDAKKYASRLKVLGQLAKENKLDLMIDISGEALEKAGFSMEKPTQLKELGVTGLRMDYAISNEKIAHLSQKLKISLNASTITEKDLIELKEFNADFSNLEAWHNYYPRPETGLSDAFFKEKNQWLKSQGFTIEAFIPGNNQLRGPLYEQLPTLESQRYKNPFASALEMLAMKNVDLIYLGDGGITEKTFEQFKMWQEEKTILLHVKEEKTDYFSNILGEHVNRMDAAQLVIRSANARFKKIPPVFPQNTIERKKGSVTLDNEKYLRYEGEIQICKTDLPQDDKVNVVGKICCKDLPLVDLIKGGDKFYLKRGGCHGKSEFRKSSH